MEYIKKQNYLRIIFWLNAFKDCLFLKYFSRRKTSESSLYVPSDVEETTQISSLIPEKSKSK